MPRTAHSGKKDPNAPKRPPTAFFLYAQTRRDEIKRTHKGVAVSEIAKKLGQEWRNLPDAKKNKFYAQAEKENAKYSFESRKAETLCLAKKRKWNTCP